MTITMTRLVNKDRNDHEMDDFITIHIGYNNELKVFMNDIRKLRDALTEIMEKEGGLSHE